MDNASNSNPIFKLLKNPKTFGPTDWAIKNKTAVYLITLIISLWGIGLFVSFPKEQFPDVVIPNIYVQTVYVGNSPKEIESLVTRPIEKQLKGITGVKINKITKFALFFLILIFLYFYNNNKKIYQITTFILLLYL
jgi:Cu/Ag efflux pump CusA